MQVIVFIVFYCLLEHCGLFVYGVDPLPGMLH